MNKGKVLSINISKKKGEMKEPLSEGNFIEDFGLEGDAHGGKWHRQVSLLAQESIDIMTSLGAEGLCFGNFAENITTHGITLHEIPVGAKIKIGQTLQEVTQIGKECHADQGCAVAQKVGKCIMPTQGIFTRIIKGGIVKIGDEIEIIKD
ncbi:MOSC domain-containing protein [Proteocatella sphenisci]|uniref:MOSC domain-containing protein n=1 Tax=Proteocatella sphenisci TaxID=181070 RepID=UPI0004B345AB|nr:MOSC domain-containing protein [Proteocatella sphenisci]